MLNLDHASFRYDPYPICVIPDVFDAGRYEALVRSYPPLELFVELPELGNK